MKPTIKYLLNGEYHYATVKDIGDIEKLTTAVKTDLVSAINSISGGGGSVPPDLQQIIDDLQSQLEGIINGGLNDNQLLEMQKAMDESIAAMNAELQIKIDNLKTDYENKFTQVTGDYDQKVAIIKGDVTGLRDDLDATELSLKETGEKLSGIELNYTNVTQEVDNVKGSLLTKVESSDFELLESTVNANKTEIKQTKESIDLMATKESLDLATGNISDLSAKLEVQAGEIASTVKKEELKNELDGLDIYAKNILEGTTDWNGWTPVNPSNVRVLSDTYQHTQIQEQTGFGAYEETSLKDLVIGKTYTASVWARSTNIKAQPVFKINGVNSIMANKNKDTYMGSEWQRFSVKFVASAEAVTVSFTTISTVSGNKSYFAGGKVEIGTTNTGWRPSESDVFGRVVSAESSIKQQADKITSVVTQQEKIGADVTKHSTAINQLSGSIELQAKSLTEIEGKVSQNEASIKVANDSIKSKVEQSDIDKSVDGMRLDNKNAVLNSDFQREFSDWTGVNSLFKIVEINGKKYAKATRTGLTGNLPATLTTNKMPAVKGDRLMIGFDMIVDDLAKYDVQTAVMLELFNISDVRVDFKEFTLAELTGSLKNGVAGRLNTNYKIARDDVAKASLRLNLYRNGTVAYTNISMQKGDIGSTEWMPAPEDSQLIQATLKTEIDQNARDITLRATSETVNKISGDLAANTASLKVANDAITAHTQSLTKVDGKISEHDAKLVQTAKELSSKMTSTEVDSMLDKKGYATQSELKQTSEGFEIAVGSVREDTEKAIQGYDILNDKTSILSGNPIYTDKADDAVVHVGVDGKSEQTVVEGNTNLVSGSFDTMTDFDLAMNGPEFEVSSKLVPEILKGGLYTASAYIGSVTVTKGLSVMISIRNSNGSAYKQYDGAQKMSVGQSGLLVCTAEIPEITGVTGLRVTAHLRDSSGTGSKGTYRALKLEKGSTATPIPTPSPDYSSEIKSLDKSFDIVSSVGKSNLLPNSNKIVTSPNNTGLGTAALMGDESTPYYRIIATNTISTYETPIWNWMMANAIVGKQYTLSVDVRTPTGGAVNFMGGTTTSATGDIKQNVWTRVYLTFNYVSGKRYGGLVHSDKQLDYRNWKLEEGSFSPYSIIESEIQPNTPSPTSYKTNILLSEPLRSVGDVKDRLFLDSDGLWKVERNVKERIFNGNESFAQNTIGEKTVRYQYNTGVASLKHIREQIMIKSSHFQGHSNSTWTSDIEMIEQDSENINFRINKARMSEVSVAGFKNWLKSNNAIVQYSVATPTIETLPQSEQVKLNNIQSFKGSNYVYTVDGSGVVPNLNTIFKSAGWASKAKIKDVTNSVDDLESTTLPALSDGLLNKAEKESITQSLNIIRAEKTGLDSQYNSVYGNSILAGSQKTNLYNAKVAFNTAHSNLSAAIMAVLSVADNVRINQTLISKVSTEFANYGTAVATLKTRFEEALDMISGKKSSDAEANAKAHTNAQIKVMDDKIVSKVSATDFTGAKIASLISQSPDTIKIAAKNIELSGKVTFTDFDSGAQAKINEKSTKTEAQSYATTAQTNAEKNAKVAAESVAVAKATLAETTAKAYADGKVSAEETRAINDANAKLTAAKSHADTKASEVKVIADKANDGVSAINSKINNAVTTIDGTGVTVKDGSFYLEDDSSSVKYSMQTKTNPIIDHGFELLMPKFKHATLDIWSIDSQSNADGTRRSKGDSDLTIEGPSEPYIYVSYIKDVGSDMSSTPIFGSTSGVACSTAYFTTLVSNWIKPSKQYTVSAFFKKVPGLTGGMPKIVVQHVRGVANTILSTITNPTYGAVTSEINAIRYSATFTSPSSFSATSMDKIKLSFTSGNSNWVMVDGLQVAESSFPNQYNDEKTAFDIARGDFKFPVMRTDYLLATGKADVFGDMQVTQEFSAGRYVSRELKANEDLNNIKAEGWYHCPLSATAATIKNAPSNLAFSLFVEKHAGTKQTFTTYDAGNPKMWMRNEYYGWGNWKIMVDDSSWKDLSLRNVNRGNLKYRYMDGKVNLNGYIDKVGDQRSGIAIANLPTWSSPPTDTRFLGASYENHTSYPEQHACLFLLKTDGELSIQKKTGVERFYINETFMV